MSYVAASTSPADCCFVARLRRISRALGIVRCCVVPTVCAGVGDTPTEPGSALRRCMGRRESRRCMGRRESWCIPGSGAGRDDRQVASSLASACQCPGPGASGRMGRRLRAATAAALSMRACRADLACPPGDWWSLGILVRAGPFAAVAAAACLPTGEVIGRSFCFAA